MYSTKTIGDPYEIVIKFTDDNNIIFVFLTKKMIAVSNPRSICKDLQVYTL